MIIDTHVHLDDKRYDDDLNEVLDRARKGGVKRFVIPGADIKTLDKAIGIAEINDDVFFAVGVHPYDIDEYDISVLEKHITHPKCVAVGECGLDYYRLEGSDEKKQKIKEKQAKVFISQINLAKKYKKPLIVHIREATKDSKDILLQQKASEVGGVLHCFNASEELLSLANEGFYFGIGGVVTFKNAKKLVDILPKIPLEKLVVETDAPYLTPTPHRGERNEPFYTTYVVKKIADILQLDENELIEITTRNATRMFNDKI